MNFIILTGPLILALVVPTVIEPSIRQQRYLRLSIALCLLYFFWFTTNMLIEGNTIIIATNRAASAVINITGLAYGIMVVKDKFPNN